MLFLRNLLFVVAAFSPVADAHAQKHCDPSFAASTNHPYRYMERGDRCEGVYIQAVGGTALSLLSFTTSVGAIDLDSGRPIVLEWQVLSGASGVRLSAQSMRRRLFYRMDTSLGPRITRYRWPIEGLAIVKLARAELGLIGTTQMTIGGVEQQVLVPLSASQNADTRVAPSEYTLLLRPSTGLSAVFASVTAIGPDGRAMQDVEATHELGYGLYPADTLLEVPIPAPRERGVYSVRIGARLASGGSTTLHFMFINAGL